MRRADYDEAVRCYDQALGLDPANIDAFVCKGISVIAGPKDYVAAEACFRQAIEINPNIANAWAFLGAVLYEHLDRVDEAESCLHRSVALSADYWSPQVHLATLLYSKRGEFEEAEAILIELLNRRVFVARSLATLMALRCAQSDPEGALTVVEEVLGENPDDFDVLNHLAWIAHEKKLVPLYPKAEQWARRAVTLQPDVVPIRHSLIELLFNQEKWDEAMAEGEPVFEAVLARRFPASDIRESLQRAAATGHKRAVYWLDKIDTHCD